MSGNKTIYGVIAAAMLLALACAYPSASSAAFEKSGITMEVRGGYDDTALVGSYNPFYISISNGGENAGNFSGELQVVVSTVPEGRAIYAVPVTLPKGSNKTVKITAPVSTVNKKVEVRLVRGGRTVAGSEYKFRKLISPQTPVIGILCEDTDGFDFLKGMKLHPYVNTGADTGINYAQPQSYASGVYGMKSMPFAGSLSPSSGVVTADTAVEIIMLDEKTMPDDIKVLNAFRAIIIADFDTSSLSGKQTGALCVWVNGGKNLFICTGPNWKKVYSGIPDELKPLLVDDSRAAAGSACIESYAGADAGPIQGELKMATGRIRNGKAILSDKGVPVAVAWQKQNGSVSVLTFDPSLEPFRSWPGNQAFWNRFIREAETMNAEPDYLSRAVSSGQTSTLFMGTTSNVPEGQTPPYGFLLLITVLYIAVVGPLLYILLKWKDKRDWNWVVIPVLAFLAMGVIYLAGFKTRFDSAVMNCISLIYMNDEEGSEQIGTAMGIFGNKTGAMKIGYDAGMNLGIDMNNYYYRGYYYNPQNNDTNSKIISKYTNTGSSADNLEIYGTRIWEPRFFNMSSVKHMKGSGLAVSFSIKNGGFKADIKNDTDYDMEESFIILGNSFIDAGNIPGKSVKSIDTSLAGRNVKKDFNGFLDARYGKVGNYAGPGSTKYTPETRENYRKREILNSFYHNLVLQDAGRTGVIFCALNHDSPVGGIVINGKPPKTYSTNIIMKDLPLRFSKGDAVELPVGIIKAYLAANKDSVKVPFPSDITAKGGNSYLEQVDNGSKKGVIYQPDGYVYFTFTLPGNVDTNKIDIGYSSFKNPNVAPQQPGSSSNQLPKDTYKYYIYNNRTSSWEEKKQEFTISSKAASYADSSGTVLLCVGIKHDRNNPQGDVLGYPYIAVSGVAK